LAQHRSSRVPDLGDSTNDRRGWSQPAPAEVTDIIPFNEFGNLDELEFYYNTAFDTEAQVLHAPELDDLNDLTEPQPLRLVVPREFRAAGPRREPRYRTVTDRSDDVTDVVPVRRGNHRKQTGTVDALKGRLLIAAMATGAAAAAAHSAVTSADAHDSSTVLAAGQSTINGAPIESSKGVQLIPVASTTTSSMHGEELAKGTAFAEERAQREARLQRPLYVKPTQGVFTSGFGYRWGVLHAGVDLANSIGTPILAVADGVVIDAGPTSGYGAWVKLRHADGTVTLYGHVNTWLVSIGQRVMAGDQIATIGNRGNSTGPHLHFEVLLGGNNRVDPLPWLSARGINVGPYVG
jgi:murein DD-endopeptidase MepM/ murein hydrolase activator NlpD